MHRYTLILPFALPLLSACDDAPAPAAPTGPVTARCEPLPPADPCESLTEQAHTDIIAVLDRAIDMAQRYVDQNPGSSAGASALAGYTAARQAIVSYLNDFGGAGTLDPAALAPMNVYSQFAFDAVPELASANYAIGYADAGMPGLNGPAAFRLGIEAERLAHRLAEDALACEFQTHAACGDGVVDPTTSEQCDDGNLQDNDGCTILCQSAFLCNPWIEDACPDGEKCVAFANDGGTAWNDMKCTPIAEDAASVGDPCLTEGGVSGIDNCEAGAMCWNVDAENNGTCVAQCGGFADAPTCDPGSACMIANEGALQLCLDTCEPLSGCAPGMVCVAQSDDLFVCLLDYMPDTGQAFDPCEYPNVCNDGLFCAPSDAALECDPQAAGCCLPYCSTDNPTPCPGQGQVCLPRYEEGTAPSGLEHLGTCGIPF